MKIGILTLHSQINYGGVLQAYALQRVLRNKGYDAEEVDKIDPNLETKKQEKEFDKLKKSFLISMIF